MNPQMPTLFIPHGAGPCFFMDWNPPKTWDRLAHFLSNLSESLPAPPSAILVISGHWLEQDFAVTSGDAPKLIYDYSGFPAHTYQIAYPAPGSPDLAARVTRLLTTAGFAAHADAQRGFDHGVFIPLKLMFPDANIPVVQLSLRRDLDAAAHLQMGAALAGLREDDVLIVGSGMSFHNMRGYGDPRFGPISDEFDQWLTKAVETDPDQRQRDLTAWAQAPSARLSHPPHAEEHLLPLMVVAGAAGSSRGQKVFSDRVLETTVSAFRFG